MSFAGEGRSGGGRSHYPLGNIVAALLGFSRMRVSDDAPPNMALPKFSSQRCGSGTAKTKTAEDTGGQALFEALFGAGGQETGRDRRPLSWTTRTTGRPPDGHSPAATVPANRCSRSFDVTSKVVEIDSNPGPTFYELYRTEGCQGSPAWSRIRCSRAPRRFPGPGGSLFRLISVSAEAALTAGRRHPASRSRAG